MKEESLRIFYITQQSSVVVIIQRAFIVSHLLVQSR